MIVFLGGVLALVVTAFIVWIAVDAIRAGGIGATLGMLAIGGLVLGAALEHSRTK